MTEGDLQALSELLLQLDSDNVGTAITLDLGGITTTGQTQVSPGQTLVSTGQNLVSTGQTKVSTGQPQVSTSHTQVSTGQTYVEVFNFYFFTVEPK